MHLIVIGPCSDPGPQHAHTLGVGRAGEEGPRAGDRSQQGPLHRLGREGKLPEGRG